MSSSNRAFIGGLMMLLAAGLLMARKGGLDFVPSTTYEKVYFVLLDESSEPSTDLAILVNSEKWQGLSARGVETMRYDVTRDDRKPELEGHLKNLGATKPPAIVVYDAKTNKFVGVEASPTLATLDSLVKKYTGK